jgi:hypothetical protein
MVYTDLLLLDTIEVSGASSTEDLPVAPLNVLSPVDSETATLYSRDFIGLRIYIGNYVSFNVIEEPGVVKLRYGFVANIRVKWVTNKHGYSSWTRATFECQIVPCTKEQDFCEPFYYNWGDINPTVAVNVPWCIHQVLDRTNNYDPHDFVDFWNAKAIPLMGTTTPYVFGCIAAPINGAKISFDFDALLHLLYDLDHYKFKVDLNTVPKHLQLGRKRPNLPHTDATSGSAAEEASVAEEPPQEGRTLGAKRPKPKKRRAKAPRRALAVAATSAGNDQEGSLDEEEQHVAAPLPIPNDPDAWMVIVMQTSIITWSCTETCTYVFLFP